MPDSTEPIIRFSGVSKAFADNVVYQDLSLEVFQGETLTVIGGSGVGKSVMLKLLIRLMEPDSGTIEAFGKDVSKMDSKELLKLRGRKDTKSRCHLSSSQSRM